MTETAGASVVAISPRSVIVPSLSDICSSASWAWVTILPIFRTSVSSLAKTAACWVSCFARAETTERKMVESRCLILFTVASSCEIRSLICLSACSIWDFRGRGALTLPLSLSMNPGPWSFLSHFSAKLNSATS